MQNPFAPPLQFLFSRFLMTWIFVAVLTWPLVGIVGGMVSRGETEQRGKNLMPAWSVDDSGAQWAKTKQLWELNPAVCVPGQEQSDFSRTECEGIQARRRLAVLIMVLPASLGFFMAILVMDTIAALYRRSAKKLSVSGSVYLAQVLTQTPLSPGLFGWWYGLQPVLVQGKQRTAHTVWLLGTDPRPRSGQQLACTDMGYWLGKPRQLGRLYAPDVFVI